MAFFPFTISSKYRIYIFYIFTLYFLLIFDFLPLAKIKVLKKRVKSKRPDKTTAIVQGPVQELCFSIFYPALTSYLLLLVTHTPGTREHALKTLLPKI